MVAVVYADLRVEFGFIALCCVWFCYCLSCCFSCVFVLFKLVALGLNMIAVLLKTWWELLFCFLMISLVVIGCLLFCDLILFC